LPSNSSIPGKFITLRKRNAGLLKLTQEIPDAQWSKMKLKIPKRKNQIFLVHECKTQLKGCTLQNNTQSGPKIIISN